MSLSDLIKTGKTPVPWKMTVYGVAGIGKTTYAASTGCILQPTEEGYQQIDVPHFEKANTFSEVMSNIGVLFEEKGGNYPVYALDSLDWLEQLIHLEVCGENNVDSIEKIGYGKGYKFALQKWQAFLQGCDALRSVGMNILFISHEQIKRFDNPLVESYDRYELKLHKSANDLVKEYVDGLLFANYKTFVKKQDNGFGNEKARGLSSGERVLYTQEQPALVAKNRFNMPKELPFTWEAVKEYLDV